MRYACALQAKVEGAVPTALKNKDSHGLVGRDIAEQLQVGRVARMSVRRPPAPRPSAQL